jgi:hypothetical protein
MTAAVAPAIIPVAGLPFIKPLRAGDGLQIDGNVLIGTATDTTSRLVVVGAGGAAPGGRMATFTDNNSFVGANLVIGWTGGTVGNKYKSISVDAGGLAFGTMADALTTAPTTRWLITNTGGHFAPGANNVSDIGLESATRPRRIHAFEYMTAGAYYAADKIGIGSGATSATTQLYQVVPTNTVGHRLDFAVGQLVDMAQWNPPLPIVAGKRARITKNAEFSNNKDLSQSEMFGEGASVGDQQATAFGYGASAQGAHCSAFGASATAAYQSAAFGYTAFAGWRNVAIGWQANCNSLFGATGQIAIGYNAQSNFASSIAIGSNAVPTAANQFVSGSNAAPITDVFFGIGTTPTTTTNHWTLHGSNVSSAAAGGDVRIVGGSSASGTAGNVVLCHDGTAARGTVLIGASASVFSPAPGLEISAANETLAYTTVGNYQTNKATITNYNAANAVDTFTAINLVNRASGVCFSRLVNINKGANISDFAINVNNVERIYISNTGTTTIGTAAAFDGTSGAGTTRLQIYDVDTAALARVKVGAAGSGPGGAGRALYI